MALKGLSGADRISTHIHIRGTIEIDNSSGSFDHQRDSTEEHHDRGRVLKEARDLVKAELPLQLISEPN